MGYRIAVAGATGMVGRELLKTLAERDFPADEVIALASGRAVGGQVSFGEKGVLTVQSLEKCSFSGIDAAFFAAGAKAARTHAPRAAEKGCMVIDLSPAFRMDDEVPLVVPEVNPEALDGALKQYIVAVPAASVTQLLVALAPLQALAPIRRVVASTYQSVSGAGKEAMDELFNQTRAIYVNDPTQPEQFPKPISFNVIPQVERFRDDGLTDEEWQLAVEPRKVLGTEIQVTATCVRVPSFIGHAEALAVEFESEIALEAAREALREAPGVLMVDRAEDGGYVTPVDCAGEDAVYVSRLRVDPSVPHGLSLWCVADNLRKGTALNAVQVAELMHEKGLLDI